MPDVAQKQPEASRHATYIREMESFLSSDEQVLLLLAPLCQKHLLRRKTRTEMPDSTEKK
jgi:hypothetical protein